LLGSAAQDGRVLGVHMQRCFPAGRGRKPARPIWQKARIKAIFMSSTKSTCMMPAPSSWAIPITSMNTLLLPYNGAIIHEQLTLSTHALASTVPSVGLHSMSSTLAVWPAKVLETTQEPPSRGVQVCSFPRQSPDASAPTSCGDHASA
jgi:hypothetical protein